MARFPELDFKHFSIKEMKELWDGAKILMNEEYQRSYIWKLYQRRDLIESIMKGFSIGVLVIWKNKENKLEILDGQQRIKTIITFLNNEFKNNENKKFSELTTTEQSEIEGYSVYYLRLKSDLIEEEISDIFTRLQEGTPLNIAEKVNAFRGKFRESFMEAFLKNKIFFEKLKNYRFRARFLVAQLLLLELETNFEKKIFPNMRYRDFERVNEKYKKRIPKEKLRIYNGYINFLGTFLYNEIKAISYRDWISLYLLASFLHKKQANKEGLGIYFRKFVLEFMKNLTSFSIYDTSTPKGITRKLFRRYMAYKQFGRKATYSDSIEKRFNIILSEYKRVSPKIKYKDKIRLFNEEEKIRVYFKQNCLCALCKRPLDFSRAQCHHKDEYSKGGKTKIKNAQMLHPRCHAEIHKKKKVHSRADLQKMLRDHLTRIKNHKIKNIFKKIREEIKNLEGVEEKPRKSFIGYWRDNVKFLSIHLYQNHLVLWIRIRGYHLDDPKHLVKELKVKEEFWKKIYKMIYLKSIDQIPDVMHLIRQAYEKVI